MTLLFRLVRAEQWTKNIFLFIPLFFAGDFFNFEKLLLLTGGFFVYNLTASGIYIFNDSKDLHVDRLHPIKRKRPLAAGDVSLNLGLLLSGIFIISGLILSYFIGPIFFVLISIYVSINLGYSLGLKNISIIDLFIISFGFILRILAGGFIAQVDVSHWLLIMIFLLSLFLVIAKRRDDLILQRSTSETLRKSSTYYNLEFINACLTFLSATIIVSYIMYTVSYDVIDRLHSKYLFITTIFVLAGMMRYMQITLVDQKSGSPTDIFIKDKFIFFTIVCWVITYYIIIYAT